MSSRINISSIQIFWLMTTMEIGMSILLSLSQAIQDAKQDAWISMIVANCSGLLITLIALKASLLYPHQTLIQFSQTILGKWLGKAIVLPYFVMWYSVIGIVLRQSSDFIHMVLFRHTPLWVVILMALILIIYATYQGGIEGIARCSELLGPFIVVALSIIILLSIGNMHWERILPIYQDNGVLPILRGAISPTGFIGESTMMTMLVAFMTKPQKSLSHAMWGVALACLFLLISTIAVILTFGELASKMWFPFFDMARFVSIMNFIQNIDSLIVIIWMCSVFIKLSLYMFIASYGTAQWFGIKSWKRFIWVISFIAFVISLLPANIVVSSVDYQNKLWTPYILPINMVGIPMILWIVGSIRKKMQTNRS